MARSTTRSRSISTKSKERTTRGRNYIIADDAFVDTVTLLIDQKLVRFFNLHC